MRMHLTRGRLARTALLAALAAGVIVAAFAPRTFAQTSSTKSSAPKSTTTKSTGSTTTKSTTPGYLGVTTQTLTDRLRDGLGFTYAGDGALVSEVMDDSPASTAGIQRGDVITAVGTRAITSSESLTDRIQAAREGDVVAIKVMRKSGTRTLNVKLAGRSDDEDNDGDSGWSSDEPPMAPSPPTPPAAPHARTFYFNNDDMRLPGLDKMMWIGNTRGRLGIQVENMVPELSDYFRGTNGKGVIVKGVNDDTPASRAGFKVGDVIVKVGDASVDDSDDLMKELRKVDQGKVSVTVVRKGATQTLTPELEKRQDPETFTRYYMDHGSHSAPRRIVIDGDTPDCAILERDDLRREIEDQKRNLTEPATRFGCGGVAAAASASTHPPYSGACKGRSPNGRKNGASLRDAVSSASGQPTRSAEPSR
jgi:membrane-associated protease RseP (regulator of RpoE activity)